MNLNSLWVESMSGHGFDTIHWSTVGESTAPETQIIEFAAANGYTGNCTRAIAQRDLAVCYCPMLSRKSTQTRRVHGVGNGCFRSNSDG